MQIWLKLEEQHGNSILLVAKEGTAFHLNKACSNVACGMCNSHFILTLETRCAQCCKVAVDIRALFLSRLYSLPCFFTADHILKRFSCTGYKSYGLHFWTSTLS